METNWRHKKKYGPNSQFKSYYVVWKPSTDIFLNTTYICLNRTMQYGNQKIWGGKANIETLFKSYYVVWKRIYSVLEQVFLRRLNRTMQYRNFCLLCWSGTVLFRLNRTMQYGNLRAQKWRRCLKPGLNRTMQYGNSYVSPIFFLFL